MDILTIWTSSEGTLKTDNQKQSRECQQNIYLQPIYKTCIYNPLTTHLKPSYLQPIYKTSI